ncbi:MAG TPA: IPExxxVDY family protein [Bacteroidia bacterium]
MGKHTLEIEYDYDFVLIGISSHEKDYRFCWAINNKLKLELSKKDSLEIKGKKQATPSYFSFFTFDDADQYTEYSVIANFSESKSLAVTGDTLFGSAVKSGESHSENEFLVPEHKQMNYLFIVRGEMEDEEVESLVQQIKEIDIVLTAVRIDPKTLRSKQNLIF